MCSGKLGRIQPALCTHIFLNSYCHRGYANRMKSRMNPAKLVRISRLYTDWWGFSFLPLTFPNLLGSNTHRIQYEFRDYSRVSGVFSYSLVHSLLRADPASGQRSQCFCSPRGRQKNDISPHSELESAPRYRSKNSLRVLTISRVRL